MLFQCRPVVHPAKCSVSVHFYTMMHQDNVFHNTDGRCLWDFQSIVDFPDLQQKRSEMSCLEEGERMKLFNFLNRVILLLNEVI